MVVGRAYIEKGQCTWVTSQKERYSGHQMGKGSGEDPIENKLEKDRGKGAGISSSILEWGPKGGTGSVQLEKNCGGLMRCMARQGLMMMMVEFCLFKFLPDSAIVLHLLKPLTVEMF